MILVRKANPQSERVTLNKETVSNGTKLYKRRDEDINYTSVVANEAYATGACMHDNIAYTSTGKSSESNHDYEEYDYI